LGSHKFRLSVYPHKGNWEEGLVYPEALKFNQPLVLVETNNLVSKIENSVSFIKIKPENLIFSCFKKSEDEKAFVLRIYNPTEKKLDGEIEFLWKLTEVELITLEEKTIQPLNFSDNFIRITIEPKKIFSLKVYFKTSNV
jgi:alpha-mannosidase